MKQKEEVIAHLYSVGYTKEAIKKVMAFLIGAGLKEFDEVLRYKKGLGTFEDFYEWFNGEEDVAVEIYNDIVERLNNTEDEKERNRLYRQLAYVDELIGDESKPF